MKRNLVLTSLLGLLMGATGAEAQEGGPDEWLSGNVSVTSDYAFRGISQTLEEPALQGGFDLEHPTGLYLGAWGSSVNFGEDLSAGPRAQLELDVYGGYGVSLGGLLDLDLGAIYYMYPGAGDGRSYDFLELGLGAGRDVGPVSTSLSFQYSPDFFAGSGQGMYFGAEVGVPVSMLTLSGLLGHQTIEANDVFGTPDYTEWGLGASVGLFGLDVGARYLTTTVDEDECFGGSDLCGPRFVVSVGRAM